MKAVRGAAVAALITAVWVTAVPSADSATIVLGTVVSPNNASTVADPAQATGRRLSPPPCNQPTTTCDERQLLAQLDGFDLDPVVEVRLDELPDRVDPTWGYIESAADGERIPLDRLVLDEATRTLTGRPSRLLREASEYRAVFAPPGAVASSTTFTTLSVSPALRALRDQLDGPAYAALGVPESERGITLADAGGRPAVFDASEVTGLSRRVDLGTSVRSEALFNLTDRSGSFAVGSFRAPRWLAADRVIAPAPTRGRGPAPVGVEEVGVAMVLPAGPAPEGGWPVVLFAPGITRSRFDVLLAAGSAASDGLAVIALDPAGHGGGPLGAVEVRTVDSDAVVVEAPGRGVDVDGDGAIGPSEGVSAPSAPHPAAGVGLRDGLRQSAADLMALAREVDRGLDVDGDGRNDLDGTRVRLLGQSLGASYGALAVAVDDRIEVGVLNAVGGPVTEIARLAPGTRPDVAAELAARRPPLAIDDLAALPAPGEATRRTVEDPVEADVRATLARLAHLQRGAGAEAVAPLLAGGRAVLQLAVGDRTVPNATSATVVQAGGLGGSTTTYRHDLTGAAERDPHGFLLDPSSPGNAGAQAQARAVLADPGIVAGGAPPPDPDGEGPLFEAGAAAITSAPEPASPAPTDGGTAPEAAAGPAGREGAGRRAVLSVAGLVLAAGAGGLFLRSRWRRQR